MVHTMKYHVALKDGARVYKLGKEYQIFLSVKKARCRTTYKVGKYIYVVSNCGGVLIYLYMHEFSVKIWVLDGC